MENKLNKIEDYDTYIEREKNFEILLQCHVKCENARRKAEGEPPMSHKEKDDLVLLMRIEEEYDKLKYSVPVIYNSITQGKTLGWDEIAQLKLCIVNVFKERV